MNGGITVPSGQTLTSGGTLTTNTITTSGNVTIGTTDISTYRLNVSGDVNVSGAFRVPNTSKSCVVPTVETPIPNLTLINVFL